MPTRSRWPGRCAAGALLLLFVVAEAPHARGESQQVICRYCRQAEAASESEDQAPRRNYAPDRRVDVRHIKLDVTPDFDQQTVAGTATIHFQVLARPLRSLRLDGVNLRVAEVRASHPVRDHVTSKDDLTIVFDQPLATGEQAYVEIEYSAQPEKGLYFRTPEMGYPESDVHLWTQGEPYESRHWYPCFDAPNERSSTEVICRTPPEMTVLSNGRKIEEKLDPQTNLKSVRWLQEKPHANYLICLVAGMLEGIDDRHDEVPLAFFTQPSRADHIANGFRDTADIMAFYEREIGVDYPWDKYFQVTVSDFMWGGMENTTLTTLWHGAVFADEIENTRTNRRLDAHELAHQWFGNYVTCKDWSHLWLNEGFATYYTLLYEGHKFGRDALLYGLYLDAREDIFPKAEDRRPIVYRAYKRPKEQFDFRAYPKGSWVLHMLRSQVGDDLYREAVRTYLEQHALTHVETEELRAAFESISGQTLDRFFDQWVYHAGHPALKIKYKWLAEEKLAHVAIEQTQSANDDVLTFHLDTVIRFHLKDMAIDHPIKIERRKHDFYVALSEQPTVVRFDPDFTLLAEIDFEKPDAMWEAQLANGDDVIGRLEACRALAERETDAAVEALGIALRDDSFFGVRIAAAKALRKMNTDEALAALIEGLAQPDARVRLAVVRQLAKFYRQAARDSLLEIAADEPNPAIAAAAVAGLDRYHGPQAAAALRVALGSESFANERVTAAFQAIGRRRDGEFQADIIQTIQTRAGDLEYDDLSAGLQALAKISQQDSEKDRALTFLKPYVNHPRRRVRAAAIAALGELGDLRAKKILAPLADAPGPTRVAEAARDALKKIDKQAPAPSKETIELRREVRELRKALNEVQESVDELESKAKSDEKSE